MEPWLRECCESTFRQKYPCDSLAIYFCIESRSEPAFPILRDLVAEYKGEFDTRLFIAEEDMRITVGGRNNELGPNPKIRNMNTAYETARDYVWNVDCNVWLAPESARTMVDALNDHRFAHQLPLVIAADQDNLEQGGNVTGTELEEMFMASAHAKFYTAINTVAIAPCIVGKSNMFRSEHLAARTGGLGINAFSHNICEDHLIGDLLWKQSKRVTNAITSLFSTGNDLKRHKLVSNVAAFQPMGGLSVGDFVNRRTRWLRVRKFTVPLATLVEPGTESIVCSIIGSVGAAILSAQVRKTASTTASVKVAGLFFLLSLFMWACSDRALHRTVRAGKSVDHHRGLPPLATLETNDTARDNEIQHPWPMFARRRRKMPLRRWLAVWFYREVLALPIWLRAVFGGSTVVWRGRRFTVGLDAKVKQI